MKSGKCYEFLFLILFIRSRYQISQLLDGRLFSLRLGTWTFHQFNWYLFQRNSVEA